MSDEFDTPRGAGEHPLPPQPRATARPDVAAKAPRAPSDSFRRSQATLAAEIARAAARGQRVL